MKYSAGVCLMLSLLSATAETPQSVEIRFCPVSAVRTYPLESRRDLQSLLLQNAAIINHGKAAFDVKEIELELLEAGQILDTKKLDAKAIQRIANRGAKLQAAGVLQQVGFQFCGNDLVAPNIKLAGPKLDRDQALLVASQAFAFNGARDTLRVRVHGNVDDRTTEFTGSIPIKSEFAKTNTSFRYAVCGMWATKLRFTQVIAGPFRKSSRSTLLRSVKVDSATKATKHTSMIIMLTARMCSRRPTAG